MGLRKPPVEEVKTENPHIRGFKLSEEVIEEIRISTDAKDYDTLRKYGEDSGRIFMSALLPEGTPGQVVDIMHRLFVDTDATDKTTGWHPMASFMQGGISGSFNEIAASTDPQVTRLY